MASDADCLIFVGNAPDDVNFIRALAANSQAAALPVISHWGIVGGDFVLPLGEKLDKVDLVFLQTFSFFAPPYPDRAERVVRAYTLLFPEAGDMRGITAPTGVAHAPGLPGTGLHLQQPPQSITLVTLKRNCLLPAPVPGAKRSL